jgi:hypothetical protein
MSSINLDKQKISLSLGFFDTPGGLKIAEKTKLLMGDATETGNLKIADYGQYPHLCPSLYD